MSTRTHPASTRTPRPDTREMVIVHTCFRRMLGDLPTLIQNVTPGDQDRASLVGAHLSELLDSLHHHHTAEDELLWPLLLPRVAADASLVLRMEEQHSRVDTLIGRIRELVTVFTQDAATGACAELAAKVSQLGAVLGEHMAQEEQYILPLCAQQLTVAEWEALGERARSSLPKDRLLIQLGWILDSNSPADQAFFLRMLPRVARLAWLLIGRRAWRAEYRRLLEPAA